MISSAMLVMLVPTMLGDTQFYRELLAKDRATVDDGARLILAFTEGVDTPRTPEVRMTGLRQINIMPQDWNISPSQVLRADRFAYLLCRALNVKGGLSARLFGLGPRTAYRECLNLKLMRANGQDRILSGKELLSIMTRAEEYRKKTQAPKQALGNRP